MKILFLISYRDCSTTLNSEHTFHVYNTAQSSTKPSHEKLKLEFCFTCTHVKATKAVCQHEVGPFCPFNSYDKKFNEHRNTTDIILKPPSQVVNL